MHTTFTIKEALSFGWSKFKENAWFYVGLTLAFAVVSGVLDGAFGDSSFEWLADLAGLFVSFLSMYVFVRMGLIVLAGKKPSWKEALEIDWRSFGLYVVASLLFALSYSVGLVLLIVPGIIAIVRFGFYGFALVGEKIGPIHSLKKSAAITKGYFWKLFGFTLVLFLINVAGILALFVGLLVTAPVCLLATAYVYNKLNSVPETVASEPVEAVKA